MRLISGGLPESGDVVTIDGRQATIVRVIDMRDVEDVQALDALLAAARSAALDGERVMLNIGPVVDPSRVAPRLLEAILGVRFLH